MVYPSQEIDAKKTILNSLEKCYDAQSGIGYNVLFERVKDKISRITFQKYLQELIDNHVVLKELDPRHKRGVVIFLNEEASKYERLLLDLTEKFRNLLREGGAKQIEFEHGEWKLTSESKRRIGVVANCIMLAHETLLEMLPYTKESYGLNPFIRVVEQKDGTVRFEFKKEKMK
jgi:hypothetical protein